MAMQSVLLLAITGFVPLVNAIPMALAQPGSISLPAVAQVTSIPAAVPNVGGVSTSVGTSLALPISNVNLPAVAPTAALGSLPVQPPSTSLPSIGDTQVLSLIQSIFNMVLNILGTALGVSPIPTPVPLPTSTPVKERRQLGGALGATSAVASVLGHATQAAQVGSATAAAANLPATVPTSVVNSVPGVSSVSSTGIGALDPLTCIVEAVLALLCAQFGIDPLSMVSASNLMTRDTEIHEFAKRQVSVPNLPTSVLAGVVPQATALGGSVPAIGGIQPISPSAAAPFLSETLPLLSPNIVVSSVLSTVESSLGGNLLSILGSLPGVQFLGAVLALIELLSSINPSMSPLSALNNINSIQGFLSLTAPLTPGQISALNTLPIPNTANTDLIAALLSFLECINGIPNLSGNIPLGAGAAFVLIKSVNF